MFMIIMKIKRRRLVSIRVGVDNARHAQCGPLKKPFSSGFAILNIEVSVLLITCISKEREQFLSRRK